MASKTGHSPEISWVKTGEGGGGRGGMEQLTESVVSLSVSNMRPDIDEAQQTPARVKAKLVYCNTDELDTGMQKVQPLPFLDEEIERYHKEIEDSIPAAQDIKDEVPASVLSKVTHAIQLANDGKTSLFKASQLLEFTSSSYKYARFASRDNFDLKRESKRLLCEYDKTFRQLVDCRIRTDMAGAETQQEECFRQLDAAIREAELDVEALRKRAEREDTQGGEVLNEQALKEVHEQVNDMIKMEKGELEMIQDQCSSDVGTIDNCMHQLHQRMKAAHQDYLGEEERRREQLEKNRQRQRELEQELVRLRAEEERLEKDGETGEELQTKAEKTLEDASQDVNDWRNKIEELQRRTITSLKVMEHMAKCTDVIMEDAKSRKTEWKHRLGKLELESLLSLRDTLMAKGGLYMLVINDSKRNAEQITKYLSEQQRSKKEAAQTGFALRVKELEISIQQYKQEQQNYEEKLTQNSEALKKLKAHLEDVDKKVQALQPSIKLVSLDTRYSQLKGAIDHAFTMDTVKDFQFSSPTKYDM